MQHTRQRFEDLHRRAAVAATLQPQVVVGADAGQHGDLLTAQPRHPPDADDRNAGLLRSDELAAGAEEGAEKVRFPGHGTHGRRVPGLTRGPCQDPG
ncbi:hypothetical protein Ait01nite_057480 [Actinoplanes italicus]|nr:hypothetical protein Ait01nite_057480 [Actinoplanes italicus]